MNVIKPVALRQGDAISVVVPAGPVNRERIDRAFERLQRRGYRLKTYGDLYRRRAHLAGDDATRAKEFMAALTDQETSAVWCARGGYGTSRILERLDFDVIRQHPKVFVGFSDITAIHLAIQQRSGLITFHGPNLQDGFGMAEEMLPLAEAALWKSLVGDEAPTTSAGDAWPPGANDLPLRRLSPGVARGRFTGGNLSVISGLMGTPYEIETTGRILFLEDLDEEPYKIDRYLSQLHLAGKLQAAAGILLGSFVDDRQPVAEESLAEIDAVLVEYCSGLGVPVMAGFPAGHVRVNVTLPINAMVELDGNQGKVNVLERLTA